MLNIIFYRVEYVDFDKFPKSGPAIIVANHQHTFDVSVIHCKVKPWINWVAKRELTDIPFIGRLILKMGVLSVDRSKKDLSVAKMMFQKLRNKEIIGIFPQGTRVKDESYIGKIIPKTGAVHFAIRTKTPITPIGIKGNFKLFSKIRVVVGDPIYFSDDTDLMQKTIFVMSKVYELIGIEYKLDLPLHELENTDEY
ncbi:MAG: lysophospholipid acyltransferase family protein [Saccharofermentanales bacterium]